MALGFGFNKAKVLASAEKYVQQGKLQNAIAEYEKVVKDDPKDLTILNTIGDLYARLGQTENAVKFFKRVGDHYAGDGFTVKAIAMYKKLTKLAPSNTDCIQRLAELYTQQGLYNDAKQQYMAIADYYIKANELDFAARVFQKMLELDPENAAMQAKLADLYIRMGKKEDAKEIFFRAAESLYQRAAMDAADEAAAKVLSIEPGNARALMLRARIAIDSGNPDAGVGYVQRIPNLDSRADALNLMLQAQLSAGKWNEADPLARKLLNVHNEPGGINAYAQAMLTHGECEKAVQVYSEFSDKLLAGNPNALTEELHPLISKVKDNAVALQALRGLFKKAGDRGHVSEVTELLAHALVQAGDLPQARDLYKELAGLEPENPTHEQNYRQVMARLGEDAASRPLSVAEGEQAFMVDELAMGSPSITQEYPGDVEAAIKAALTDSELMSSYSKPEKALEPVEKALAKAPHDVRLNQRAASLYAELSRFADAARCCTVLADLYRGAGHAEQGGKYRDMAAKYQQRGGAAVAPAPPPAAAELTGEAAFADYAMPVEAPAPPAAPAEFSMEVAAEPASQGEIDLSDEWQSHVEEPAKPAAEKAARAASPKELADEARFYLAQGMRTEAEATMAKLAELAPNSPELAALRAELAPVASAGKVAEYAMEVSAPAETPVADFSVEVTPPPALIPAPASVPAPAMAAKGDVLGDLVADLEEALPADFGAKTAPVAQAAAASAAPAAAISKPVPVASAAAVPAPPSVGPPPATVVAEAGGAKDMLADIFDEFKEEAEGGVATQAEDPETHYNLGVAFKEMGLLDEAIGELQKVCHAVDQGLAFRDTMQAYTWLAQCFVDKGVPEASVQWYEKALKVAPDKDTRNAVHYDLASALEAAGNRPGALQHFLEVYGSNIDYRDVAERIKSLRS
ncbi:MAG TPA: tetratricopeptide repeat protein [Terriglobales bacterium]|nr:tetratricopeptide repeat protein [Terriglobales bacterium]